MAGNVLRRFCRQLSVVAVTLPVLLATLAVPATTSQASATVTVGTNSCAVIDSDETCVAGPFHDVATNNRHGVEVEQYVVKHVFNGTGHAVRFDYASTGGVFICISDTTGAITTDWFETLSASGQAVVICRFR